MTHMIAVLLYGVSMFGINYTGERGMSIVSLMLVFVACASWGVSLFLFAARIRREGGDNE